MVKVSVWIKGEDIPLLITNLLKWAIVAKCKVSIISDFFGLLVATYILILANIFDCLINKPETFI